jgi:hypothetical protein
VTSMKTEAAKEKILRSKQEMAKRKGEFNKK